MTVLRRVLLGALVFGWPLDAALAQDAATPAVTIMQMTEEVTVGADGTSTEIAHSDTRANVTAAVIPISQVSVSFDNARQDITVTEAYTLKPDGTRIPVAPSAIYDQLATQPSFMAVTSMRSKVIVFPQFAVQDRAVYTIKTVTREPTFKGQFTRTLAFPRSLAVEEMRHTVTAPKSLGLHVETHDMQFSQKEEGANIVYSWSYAAPKPVTEEPWDFSPLDRQPRLFISSFKDYAQLGSAYGAAVLEKRALTPKVSALADQITAGVTDRRAQAQKLYEWVSANIRYVAIFLGNGSVVPHDADSIITNGYGDCKDHDVLLQALLKAKGIESESILINSGNAYSLPGVASLATLNHVITHVPELNLYLDSTVGMAAFGVLPTDEYGKPMVVAGGPSPGLGKMPLLSPGLAKSSIKTVSVLDKDGVLTGTSQTTASGPYAITLRGMGIAIQALGPPQAAAKIMTGMGYQNAEGSLTVGSPTDPLSSYAISSTFRIPGWSADDKTPFNPPGVMRLITFSDGVMGPYTPIKGREGEDTLCHSAQISEDLSLTLQSGVKVGDLPKDVKINTPNIVFSAQYTVDGSTIRLRRDFTSTIDKQFCSGALRKSVAATLKQIADSYTQLVMTRATVPAAAAAPEDTLYAAGDKALTDKAFDLAVAEFTRLIAANKNDGRAYFGRGRALRGQNKSEAALADFDAAIRLIPDSALYHEERGIVLYLAKEYGRAKLDYDRAVELSPQESSYYFNRGLLLNAQSQRELAIADYDKAISLKPDYAPAFRNRGLAWRAMGKTDEAVADLLKASTLEPDNSSNFYDLGLIQMGKNANAAALSYFDKAIALKADNPAIYYSRANIHTRMAKPDLAIADMTKAVALRGDDANYLSERGRMYRIARQWDLSRADLDKAIAVKPDYMLAYYNRALVNLSQSKWDAALADLNQSIKLDPNYYFSYEMRGRANFSLNRFNEAVADEDTAIAMGGRSAAAPCAGLYATASMVALAAAGCPTSRPPDGKPAAAYYVRGQAKHRLGQHEDANKDIATAIRLDPKPLQAMEAAAAKE